MPDYQIKITQIIRMERTAVVTIRALTEAGALDIVSEDAVLSFEDPRWEAHHDLQNETYEIVS